LTIWVLNTIFSGDGGNRQPTLIIGGEMIRLWHRTRKCMLYIFFLLGSSFTIILPVQAEETQEPECPMFKKGQVSAQLAEGAFHSPFLVNADRREMNYYQTNLRIGLMLDDPGDPEYFFKGNWEALLDATYSDVDDNEGGGFFSGAAILLRYNILALDCRRLTPYIQAGAGIVYNDVYKNRTQNIIGQSIEFSLRGGLGFRLMITDCWSIDLEGALEHISNAGLSDRNAGVNAGGGFVGITRCF
jgi:hypothetical protein